MRRSRFAAGLALFLSACGSASNPIIGKWTAKERGFITISDIEFTSTQQIVDGATDSVKYQIKGNTVTVTPEKNIGRTCEVQGDTMTCTTPLGPMQMVRVKK
jgi:hypothetical protein